MSVPVNARRGSLQISKQNDRIKKLIDKEKARGTGNEKFSFTEMKKSQPGRFKSICQALA